MYRLSALFVLLAVFCCALVQPASGVQAAPLLQEGKKTLYQRVISHPTAVLYAEASDKSSVVNKGLRPFTPLYVYERGQGWLHVGIGTNRADGWIRTDLTTPWNQALTLLFTNRSERDPVLFFKDMQALRFMRHLP